MDTATLIPTRTWAHHDYRSDLAQLRRVRADIATDLTDFPPDLVDTVQLCASELFANSVKYAYTEPDRIRLLLNQRDQCTLTLVVGDPGGPTVPHIPKRTPDAWDWAEGQRGLLLLDNLSTSWGHFAYPRATRLGTWITARFPVP
ncbi:histidine kinase-like protein [Nocardiopsis sp. Huas11]|uniref:ATP-binding protein n=1 Tax=Nocardiopsis sp. Huas11 TaxID=2183912 RepID=UPI000EB5C337|nr:ATP-binding protein [Nocardiopsis sp. Huas11]RKS06291.1 histidine kinase-like protein [Nocardiopsis sp. Huas11]